MEVDGVVYAGSAVRPNKDGWIFASLGTFYAYQSGARCDPPPAGHADPADHTAVAVWDGSVYVFGGFSAGTCHESGVALLAGDGNWTEMAAMPRAWRRARRCSDRRPLLCSRRRLERSSAVPSCRARARRVRLPHEHVGAWAVDAYRPSPPAATAVGGQLYVIGGRSNRSLAVYVVERFDPAVGTWEASRAVAARRRRPRGRHVAGPGDRLRRRRRRQGRWVTPATWSYDPATARWTRLVDMKVPRHGFGAVIVDGRLYALGGAPCALYGRSPAVESICAPR